MPTFTHRAQALLLASLAMAGMSAAQTNSIQTAPPQGAGKPGYTIRARVPLTILDVVVTDDKGHPIHGLKQSDFTVLEDKEEVKPNSFEEHRSDDPLPPTRANLTLPPNTFANQTPLPSNRPLNILLLDSVNTPLQVQQIVHQEMLAFVKKMQPGTRVAVLNMSTHLAILQGFTSDPELLIAAINSKKAMAQQSPIEDTLQEPPAIEVPVTKEADCDHAALRAQYALTTMSQLARFLSGMPGRKNLIWFSGSAPLSLDLYTTNDCYDLADAFKVAADTMARSHVVIYPVDGRALDALAKGIPPAIRRQNLEHLTLELLAEETGGKATYTSNDLAGAVIDAIDSGSNYYTLTYTPLKQELDTKFRTISVKVDRPDVKLVYRNGYYATQPDADTHGKKIETVTPMQSAMMRGGLEPTQVLFKVKVVQSPGTDDAVPSGNKLDAKVKPPYRHYSLSYAIDVNNIAFAASPDGNLRGDFEYGVNVYNADGDELVNTVSKEVNPILPPSVYQSMLRGGANAHLEIVVPATGEYFLRVGVHDMNSDHVGAVEVSTSSITAIADPAVSSVAPDAAPAAAAGK
jgi:VWFA-related protein